MKKFINRLIIRVFGHGNVVGFAEYEGKMLIFCRRGIYNLKTKKWIDVV